jgi:hypothetical protein
LLPSRVYLLSVLMTGYGKRRLSHFGEITGTAATRCPFGSKRTVPLLPCPSASLLSHLEAGEPPPCFPCFPFVSPWKLMVKGDCPLLGPLLGNYGYRCYPLSFWKQKNRPPASWKQENRPCASLLSHLEAKEPSPCFLHISDTITPVPG